MAKAVVKKKAGMDLIGKAAKLSLAARVIIFLASGLGLGVIFYFAFYMPYMEDRDSLQSQLAGLQQQINTQQDSLRKHQAVAKLQDPVQAAYQYIQKYLPKENEMPRLVQMVSEIGARAGLTDGVTRFAPTLPAVVREDYAEIPFTLDLQGEFLTVLSFLYDFSRMDRIVNITTVDIGTPKMVDEKREILFVTVKCSGSTYRTLTQEEIDNPGKGKKK